jgi:hypothetical protein
MRTLKVYKNILYKKDPLDLHPRTLDGDLKQRTTDQLQMDDAGGVKIVVKNPEKPKMPKNLWMIK